MRLLAGVLAGQEGEFTLTGDESLTPRPMERVAAPLRRMGADVETTEGPCAARGPRLGRPARDRDRAGGGERAGEVRDPPRRPQRGRPDDGGGADPDPRPHRAHARGGGRPRAPQLVVGDRRARGCAAARGGRRPGRLLVRCAAARRGCARPRQRPHHPRSRRQPAPHRAARRARADGRARLGLRPAPRGRRAGRVRAGAAGRARGDGDRSRRGAGSRRRAAARRAPRLPRARRDASLRRAASCA